jgi:hypothetical protein
MPIQNLVEKLDSLQNVLLARATGGTADNADYTGLRNELLADSGVAQTLPPYVRTCRTLDQFWNHVKKDRARYEERRQYIWETFAPAFSAAEFGSSVDVSAPTGAPAIADDKPSPPKAPKRPRAFVSYSTKDKLVAAQIKSLFESFEFDVFVAHDDIEVSEEWRERILEELEICDVFIPVLSKDFLCSNWTQQEVGAATLRRNVAIVPLSIDGTIPTGFIRHVQGKPIPSLGVDAETAIYPLAKKFPRLVLPPMIRKVATAKSFRSAEAALAPLEPHFGRLTLDELHSLAGACLKNSQVSGARDFLFHYLPALLKTRGSDLDPGIRAELDALLAD